MCGLYGYITSLNKNDSLLTENQKLQKQRVLEGLMVANVSRGSDSTGIATFDSFKKMGLVKDIIPATDFVGCQGCQAKLRANPQLIIGHTRQATTGNVTARNAHPFKWGKIVGAHNGIVSNHLEIDKKVEVDSEVIFKLLNKEKNNFQKVFKRLSGSFAIVWVNLDEPNSVYLIRQDNPLSVAVVPSLKTLFWASEPLALITAITAVLGGQVAYELFNLKSEYVYKIDSKLKISKTKVEFKTSSYNYVTEYHAGGYYDDYDEFGIKESNKRVVSLAKKNDNEAEKLEWVLGVLEEWGCEQCGEKPTDGVWFDEENQYVVCSKCRKSNLFKGWNLEYLPFTKLPIENTEEKTKEVFEKFKRFEN